MSQIKMGKGWRKWPMIIFIIVLLALVIMVATSCSSGSGTTARTPIQLLQENVSALSTQVGSMQTLIGTQGLTVGSHTSSINSMQTNLTGYGERIANLETRNCSCNATSTDLTNINASITMLGLRLTALEGMNISARLAALEAHPTPTPAPNGSTPTPTPSGNHAPTIITLLPVRIGMTNDSWIVTCAANDSDGDALSYLWASTGGNIALLSGNSSVLWWGLTVNGTYAIVAQVSDGRGGYDIEVTSVVYP